MTYYLKLAQLLGASAIACSTTVALAGTPAGFLEYSSIVGAGQTITISRLPTTDSSGVTHYYDVGVVLTINSDGSVGTTAPVTANPSPPLIIDNFVAGHYTSNSSGAINVAGPGVDSGGQTVWSLAAAASNVCTNPPTATWYTGPISQNLLAKRLKKAKITSTDYSYGIVGPGDRCDNWFEPGALIGAKQIASTLVIASFSYGGSEDQSLPGEPVTFTLQQ